MTSQWPQQHAKHGPGPRQYNASGAARELTVAWEGQMEEAFERNQETNYEQLVGNCQSIEWRISGEPIEGAVASQASHPAG